MASGDTPMTPSSQERDATALLPCPFCGSAAKISGLNVTAVGCTNDQCVIYSIAIPFNNYGHRADAIAAWNRRAAPAAPTEGTLPTREEFERALRALTYCMARRVTDADTIRASIAAEERLCALFDAALSRSAPAVEVSEDDDTYGPCEHCAGTGVVMGDGGGQSHCGVCKGFGNAKPRAAPASGGCDPGCDRLGHTDTCKYVADAASGGRDWTEHRKTLKRYEDDERLAASQNTKGGNPFAHKQLERAEHLREVADFLELRSRSAAPAAPDKEGK